MIRKPKDSLPERAVKTVRWSCEPEKQQWMLDHAHLENVELSSAFKEKFGFLLSRPQITLWRQMNDRCVRKSHNGGRALKPIGTEYIGKDGYVMIKVAMRSAKPGAKDNWKLKHVWIWEQENGPLPEDCNIYFADHDRRNFDPANLVAAPKKIVATLNNKELAYAWNDAESLKACINHALLNSKITDLEIGAERPCKVCGRPFVPDIYEKSRKTGNLATCKSCIKAGKKAAYRGDAGLGICKVCGRSFRKSRPRHNTRCPECRAEKRWKPRKGVKNCQNQ